MSQPLSYFTTVEEIEATSDDVLREGFGFLSPDTVVNYVMELRQKLRVTEESKAAAETEIVRLRGLLKEKETSTAAAAFPNLTFTGYSQEPGSSKQISTSLESEKINNLHSVKLLPGFEIQAAFLFKKGTEKFNLNLMSQKDTHNFYTFHLDFRLYPMGNVIVMNTNPAKSWEQEVRAVQLPQFIDSKIYNVTIQCEDRQFRIKINDNYLESSFPYRYPLQDVAVIKLNHGSLGNRWVSLNWKPTESQHNPPNIVDTKCRKEVASCQLPPISNITNLDRTLQPGMKISARAFFRKGTKKFTINLLKEGGFNLFHLDFRPYPHGNVIVMNTNPSSSWEKEIRADLPPLSDGQMIDVVIECDKDNFKVKVNGNYIGNVFQYRYSLEDVKMINVIHGSCGNKWIALNYN
ncbi:hypothetical protein ACHWQZ_G013994 [Mnemiopsis leidyi]